MSYTPLNYLLFFFLRNRRNVETSNANDDKLKLIEHLEHK